MVFSPYLICITKSNAVKVKINCYNCIILSILFYKLYLKGRGKTNISIFVIKKIKVQIIQNRKLIHK